MEIPFTSCPEPTLGVEVELHLVDADTGALANVAGDVLNALTGQEGAEHPKAKHELFQSTIEIITDVCTHPAEAVADLRATLDEVRRAAEPLGAVPMAAGTHPFSCPEDQQVSPKDRYHALIEEMQWTARRLLICGTHFHVGVPSGEHAVAVLNELLRTMPLLQILSASSPFFEGQDTGMASVRPKIFESLPTAGLPPEVADWADFEEFMGTLVNSGVIRSVKEVWWDIRPHPEFGTVELRMCDASPTFREVAALAALAQCLVADAVARFDAGDLPPPPRPWTTRENRWLASRHGVNADLIATADGRRRPAELLLEELVERLRPTAEGLGCRAEVDDALEIWAAGPSYLRQRHIVEAGGTLEDVATHLVGELRDEEVRAAVPVDAGGDGRRTA
ncbi:MAG: glutamate--cysteine ligase [Acidimicrobiia bacterium]